MFIFTIAWSQTDRDVIAVEAKTRDEAYEKMVKRIGNSFNIVDTREVTKIIE